MKKIVFLIVCMIFISFSVSASWQYIGNEDGVDVYIDSQDVRVEEPSQFNKNQPLTIKTKMKVDDKREDVYVEADVDFYESGWMKMYNGRAYHRGTGELVNTSNEEHREQIRPGSIEDKISKNLFAQYTANKKASESKVQQQVSNYQINQQTTFSGNSKEAANPKARGMQIGVLIATMAIIELLVKEFKSWGYVGFTFRCIFTLITIVVIFKSSYYPPVYRDIPNTIATMVGANVASMAISLVITLVLWGIYRFIKSKS